MKPKRVSPPASPLSQWKLKGCLSWTVLLFTLLCALLLLPLASVLSAQAWTPDSVPFPLHSVLKADYGTDRLAYKVPALDIGVIEEVIQDNRLPDSNDRMIEIGDLLQTPVPTVTPRFPGAFTPAPRPIFSPTAVRENSEPTSRLTPAPPTPSPFPSQTPLPTQTNTEPAPTSRPVFLPSPTPTKSEVSRPTSPPATEPSPVIPPTAETKPTQSPDPYPEPDPGSNPEPTTPAYP